MSIQVMAWVMGLPKARVPNPTDAYVLLILGNYASADGGSVFPSIKLLEATTKLHRRTIQAAMRRLEKRGLIVRASNKVVALTISRPDKRPNSYRINMASP